MICISWIVAFLVGCGTTSSTATPFPVATPSATPTLGPPATQARPTLESLPTWQSNPGQAARNSLEVNKIEDMPYTSEQLLDVYYPAAVGDWPVVVVYHGGGDAKWVVAELSESIAALGAVVFTPTYYSGSSGGEPQVGKGPEDAACAVRFARVHAIEYGGNDGRLIVVGHSLGGMMGSLMMLAGDEFHGDCLVQEGSALPDAFVGLDGGFDPIPFMPPEVLASQPEACLAIVPFTYIGRIPVREGISFLLLVGTYATAQQEAQILRDALLAAGYEVSLFQIPGIDHYGMSQPQPQVLDAITSLLQP